MRAGQKAVVFILMAYLVKCGMIVDIRESFDYSISITRYDTAAKSDQDGDTDEIYLGGVRLRGDDNIVRRG